MSKMSLSFADRMKIPYILDDEDSSRLLTIQKLMDGGNSWKEIEATLEIGSLYHWTKRNIKKIHKVSDAELEQLIATQAIKFKKQSKPKINHNVITLKKQPKGLPAQKLPKYGELPPTGYISPLNNDDWLNKYCGYTWVAPYLTELRERVWTTLKLLILEPRGHGKTLSVTGLFTRWLAEKHTPILVLTSGSNDAKMFRAIKVIMQSDMFREDYGDIVDSFITSETELWLLVDLRINEDGVYYHDPSLKIAGRGSNIIGAHPAWIHLEDVIQGVPKSDKARNTINKWYDSTVQYMARPDTKVTLTGTRKGVNDFYNYMIEQHYFPILRKMALEITSGRLPTIDEIEYDHEKRIVIKYPNVGTYKILDCPDWDLPHLLWKFIFQYRSAEAEMNNNPIPSGGLYLPAHSYKEVNPILLPLNYYIVVDPGFSDSARSSGSAVLVVTIFQGKIYVVDAIIAKLTMVQLNKHVVDLHIKWKPLQTIIENNYAQITNKAQQFAGILLLKGLKLIENFTNKLERISALEFPLSRNDILIYNTCSFKNHIEVEMRTFDPTDPDKKNENYNALDAIMIAWDNLSMLAVQYNRGGSTKIHGGLKAGSYKSRLR